MTKISDYIGRRFVARVGAVCAAWAMLATPAHAQVWGGEEGPEVNVTDYGTVDLAVQDTDLAQVLEMLSIQGRKNIITSKNVSATVSANLYDVTFYEALDAILSVNGYGYTEKGNFIYIYTQEELAEVEAASRRTESRIFQLEYLSAGGADSYAYEAKLVVNDYTENLDAIATLLEELDTPPQQVLIEASILQTTLDEANSYGVDFAVIADMDFLDLTDPLSPVNNLLNGDDPNNGFQPDDNEAVGVQSTVGNTKGAGGFKVGVVSDEISVFLKLLDEVTDLSVLARPKIMALNRQRAEVLVGARVGYLSTTATQTTTTQTVQFLDTGIHLTFRPFISKNGMIRMELSPSVSEASLRTVTDAQGLQVTIPDELTNEMTTNVRVKDGQTLVLGGLFRESTRVTQRQVPFLG
ncbi:MAG: type II secretion system protein GspD, partial [Planctomycetota bacterium]